MIAVVGVGMVMDPARAVIDDMGHHDQDNRYGEEPKLVMMPYLFEQQKSNAGHKYDHGYQAMVMFPVSVPHRPGADDEGEEYHEVLKKQIINYIDPENGQAGHGQWQYSTMNGAG